LPYMFHCHLLQHEDNGMMGQFVVVRSGQAPSSPAHQHRPSAPQRYSQEETVMTATPRPSPARLAIHRGAAQMALLRSP
jgi:hypothetical protein